MSVNPAELRNETSADPGNLVFEANQAGKFLQLIENGMLGVQLPPRSLDDLWPGEPAQRLRHAIRRAIRARASVTEFIALDGDAQLEAICVPQGPDRVLVIARDRSAREQALLDMQRVAYTDKVTGLPNREFLFSELERIVEHQRLRDGRLAMIALYAGPLEDAGAPLGARHNDLLLKEVARRLTVGVRNCNDLNGEMGSLERYSVVARIDHRRFGILLPSIDSGVEAESIVRRLIDNLSQPVEIDGRSIAVTTQGGVALYPQDGMTAKALYRNAETALEDARHDGDESFRFHTGTVRMRTLQRQDLEVELRAALDAGAMQLRYLPVVDAKTQEPVSFEALLRWPQNFAGRHSTAKIVEFAERTGFILDIGDWVLRSALGALKSWRESGYCDVRLSLNFSLPELVDESCRRRLRETLEAFDLPADSIDIEIAERSLVRESTRDFQNCRQLKNMGVGLVVDDFGTGMHAIAQLARSGADAVKIDRSVVAHVDDNDHDRRTSAAIVAMARELGMRVVAEGVETIAQKDVLVAQGCGELQGFLFTQPIAEDDIADFLASAPGEEGA